MTGNNINDIFKQLDEQVATYDHNESYKQKKTEEEKYEAAVKLQEKAYVATGLFVVVSSTAENAAPLLAITGIGIPLAASLVILGKMAQLRITDKKLTALIGDCKNIITVISKGHSLIIKKIDLYLRNGEEYPIREQTMNEGVISKLLSQITRINALFETLIPPEKTEENVEEDTSNNSYFGSFKRKAKKGFGTIKKGVSSVGRAFGRFRIYRLSPHYLSEITRELSLLNSFYILYLKQYDELENFYHTKLSDDIIKQIQIEIVNSSEYKDFVNDTSFDNMLNKINKKIEENPKIGVAVKEEEEKAEEESNNIVSKRADDDGNKSKEGGKRKTKRNKFNYKKKKSRKNKIH
jgi:hypothetical protein